jgi:hypothetical protein
MLVEVVLEDLMVAESQVALVVVELVDHLEIVMAFLELIPLEVAEVELVEIPAQELIMEVPEDLELP